MVLSSTWTEEYQWHALTGKLIKSRSSDRQFHSKNIQDCCFAIPARKSPDTFDISDPSDDKELVFGRLYCIFRIELVSDMDIDGEPEERDLVLLKVLFCYNFVPTLYTFCIQNVYSIINFVYRNNILYSFCIQNWYKINTKLIHFHFGRSFHGLIQSICK